MFENNRNAYLTAFGLSLAPLPFGGLILLMINLGVPLPGILETLLLATGFGISPLYITYSAYQQLGESWKQAAAFLLITGTIHL
ncbi:MAG: hypothetical protein SVU32_06040, partial [Candidatus Nanohaloarchaea archaeon]|nr:hypothetical protein [Candidatus Nanohaloarchaea archaeon]